jgi:hypothetical protein
MAYRSRAVQQNQNPSRHSMPLVGSTRGWGPRSGRLIERPQIASEYRTAGVENTVMNEHMWLPPDLRKFHDIIEEEPSSVSMGFFRRSNIERVHAEIISVVHEMSGGAYTIGRQSEREVETMMIMIYTSEGGGDPTLGVDERVRAMNRLVAVQSAQDIIANITQHIAYMQLLTSSPPTGPALPETSRDPAKGLAARPTF